MRLLIATQVVDSTSASLGFFHAWIEKLASSFDSVEVICLYEGLHTLPANVTVHSLGKEKGKANALQYAIRFLRLIWQLRNQYDRIFVHMNQEYVLLGGVIWKLWGKRVYLWRNHYSGTFVTRVSCFLSTRVFYTSAHSYTARFRNAASMPVGVDTDMFEQPEATRKERSILFFGRVTPSKKPDLFIEALSLLKKKNIHCTASVYGPVLSSEHMYLETLQSNVQQYSLEDTVVFHEGVPYSEASAVFASHDMYVNLGDSGMYDKMLFEACASGCTVLALSEDFRTALEHPIVFEATARSLASALERTLSMGQEERERIQMEQKNLVLEHSLKNLMSKLSSAILA